MLTLSTGSACDVCAEEYGPHCLPHSVPCGHVLCATCCNTIVEKTPSRLTPVCPFCREQFTTDAVRLIRTDFTTSGRNTPRRRGGTIEADIDIPSDQWMRKDDRLFSDQAGSPRTRAEARRLEDKVAIVASKKCSVEEVSTLHKELQQWLEMKSSDETSSLALSAALLRAILINHLAHSEASRVAKAAEADLNEKLQELENANGKIEAELRRERSQYTQKAQECQMLRTELNRLKIIATTLGPPPELLSPAPSQSETLQEPVSPARPPSTSPIPPANYNSTAQSSLSRFNSTHSRSASMNYSGSSSASSSSSARSQTPAYSTRTPAAQAQTPIPRSHTPGAQPPAPFPRSHTPVAQAQTPIPRSHTPVASPQTPTPRSHTPSTRSHAPSIRSHTPSIRTQTPSARSHTPSLISPSSSMRSQTPAPPVPPLPSRTRRLSQSSPPKMYRSSSEGTKEKETVHHQLWIPSPDPDLYDVSSPPRKPSRLSYSSGMSSSSASAAAAASRSASHRYTTQNSP